MIAIGVELLLKFSHAAQIDECRCRLDVRQNRRAASHVNHQRGAGRERDCGASDSRRTCHCPPGFLGTTPAGWPGHGALMEVVQRFPSNVVAPGADRFQMSTPALPGTPVET